MNDTPTTAIGDDSKELLLFQMGPVQEFIAQAATPSDLWAGSYLLSSLILEGIKSIPDYKDKVIFPNLSDDTVVNAMVQNLIPSIPNRFMALVTRGEGETIAKQVKKEIKAKLDKLGADLPVGAQTQLDQFLQMTWAVLPQRTGDMGEDYKSISRLLAMRRNVREFDPWREDEATKINGRNGPKDFLSGKETALKDADGRGAINLLKRKLPGMFKKEIPDIKTEDDKYLAIIAMDGDKMGKTLSGLNSEPKHREFSQRLAEFAREVKGEIDEPGVLIYAGGDDVLAAVPAKKAIETAKKLAKAFADKMAGFLWKDDNGEEHPVSASAGVAIGHEKTPLLDLVHAAQEAEHRAKTLYGRNALALSVFKRSGEKIEWGCNWKRDPEYDSDDDQACESDSAALRLHKEIVGSLKDELSSRFPYKLAAFLAPYELGKGTNADKDSDAEAAEMEAVVMKELEHVWERSSEEESPVVHKDAQAYLRETFGKNRPQDFLNLFLCETFINRQRTEN